MSKLREIFDYKRQEVLDQRAQIPLHEMRQRAADAPPPRDFRECLQDAAWMALIAEIKKASPSEGVIRENFDPEELARTYEKHGASALSVLTDVKYFQGAPENIGLAKGACNLPCLRKDFIFEPYQVYQSRAWGADAILLIVAELTLAQIGDLMGLAFMLGMDCLVEVHDEMEMDTALTAQADIIGVNNRNLKTMQVDLRTSLNLLQQLPSLVFGISESGLNSHEDVRLVRAAGARGVLVGTSFCKASDPGAKVRELMGTNGG